MRDITHLIVPPLCLPHVHVNAEYIVRMRKQFSGCRGQSLFPLFSSEIHARFTPMAGPQLMNIERVIVPSPQGKVNNNYLTTQSTNKTRCVVSI